MSGKLAVGVDIGGTFIKAGVVAGGKVTQATQCPTPETFQGCVQAVGALVQEVTRGKGVESLGLGVPGVIDARRRAVLDAPNLPWMEQEELGDAVEARTGALVVVENDASAAAFGEWRHGAGRGHPDFLLATIGTGVGGGLVLEGRLYRGPGGMAGEFGHLPVGHDELCGCGARGCLEAAVAAPYLVQAAQKAGIPVHDLPDLADMARRNQEGPLRVFQRAGVFLGEAFAQVALLLDLRVFLVGGGGAPVLDLLKKSALGTLAMRAFGRSAKDFTIEEARLGNEAGMIGAAALALEARESAAPES